MASNFSPELSYSEDKSSNPYIRENSNAVENNKEYYSEKNVSSVEEDFNFVAVGDFSCNEDAKNTVINIINTDPELLLGLGDYSYETSAKCWKDIVGGIESSKNENFFW